MTRGWYCTLTYPEGWVEVHLHTGDPLEPRVTAAVDDRFPDLDRAERRRLADLVEGLAGKDAAQGAVVSAHGYPAATHRHLAVWVLPRQHEAVGAELTALTAELTDAATGDVIPPVVARCRLPIGEALRVVRLEPARGDDDADAPLGAGVTGGLLVISVSYLVPVSPPAATLWLRFWTPHLLAADDLIAEFDDIAAAAQLTRPAPAD